MHQSNSQMQPLCIHWAVIHMLPRGRGVSAGEDMEEKAITSCSLDCDLRQVAVTALRRIPGDLSISFVNHGGNCKRWCRACDLIYSGLVICSDLVMFRPYWTLLIFGCVSSNGVASDEESLPLVHSSHESVPRSTQSAHVQNMLCDRVNKEVVLAVYTKVTDFGIRDERRAELKWFGKLTDQVALFFPLGHYSSMAADDEDLDIGNRLQAEENTYHDILQSDFPDTYNTLALKFTSMLNFLRQNCNGRNDRQRYIVKVDADTAWNLGALMEWVDNLPSEPAGFIAGNLARGIRLERFPFKNYEPALPSDWEVYPPYIYGACMLLDTNATDTFLEQRERFPYLTRNDDILTGLLTENTSVLLRHDRRFVNHEPRHCPSPIRHARIDTRLPWGPAWHSCGCANWFCMDMVLDRDRKAMTRYAADCHDHDSIRGEVDLHFVR